MDRLCCLNRRNDAEHRIFQQLPKLSRLQLLVVFQLDALQVAGGPGKVGCSGAQEAVEGEELVDQHPIIHQSAFANQETLGQKIAIFRLG